MQAFTTIINGLKRLLQWWVVVAPWEQAVRVRFGKHVKLLGAGIHLLLPVDRIYRQSTRMRVCTLYGQTTTTKDGIPVTFGGAIRYHIEDLLRLYDSLHHAEGTIQNIAGAALAQFINEHTLAECTPDAVARGAEAAVDFEAFGIGDARLSLLDFAALRRTYRIITGSLQRYEMGDALNTIRHMGQDT